MAIVQHIYRDFQTGTSRKEMFRVMPAQLRKPMGWASYCHVMVALHQSGPLHVANLEGLKKSHDMCRIVLWYLGKRKQDKATIEFVYCRTAYKR